MQVELEPCPFCGGEATILIDGKYGYYTFHHDGAHKCPAAYAHYADYTTEAEAVEAWNTRAERTCKQVRLFNLIERGCDGKYYSWRGDEMPTYCPNCGAKVVGE